MFLVLTLFNWLVWFIYPLSSVLYSHNFSSASEATLNNLFQIGRYQTTQNSSPVYDDVIKWKHFSVLPTLCERNPPVTNGFPSKRLVRRSFGVFFDLRMNKRLKKQSICWWFEKPLRTLWRHCNVIHCTRKLFLVIGGLCYAGNVSKLYRTQRENINCYYYCISINNPLFSNLF